MRRFSWPARWAGMLPGVESVAPRGAQGDIAPRGELHDVAPGGAQTVESPGAVYLTFDDGPASTTAALLEVLGAEGATATFFLLGREVEGDPGLARAILAAGHSIGSHGEAHLDAWKVGGGCAVADLARGTQQIEQALGIRVQRVRPPYGHLLPSTLRWARASGRVLTLWSAMPGDFLARKGPDETARRVARFVRPGDIVALHEGLPQTAETALRTIEAVRAALASVHFAPLT